MPAPGLHRRINLNNVLLVDPYPFLSQQYTNDNHVAIWAGRELHYWVADGESRISSKLQYPAEIGDSIDIASIRSKIDWLMPIMYRWIGEAADFEIYRKTCELYVLSLVRMLSEVRPKYAVFFTGVAHHVDVSLIELACQVANVKQIYLYPSPFGSASRLLPLVQYQSIKDRKLLGVDVSSKRSLPDIMLYVNNYAEGEAPLLNESLDASAKSILYAISQIPNLCLKAFVKRLLGKKVLRGQSVAGATSSYSWLSLLKIIFKQKQALDYYFSRVVPSSCIGEIVSQEGALPIILAHYQPEATTFPEGGDFTNNIDMIVEIRRLGYRGIILYKEHPASWIYYSKKTGFSKVGMYRSVEYYKQLEALGCVFVETTYKIPQDYLTKFFPITLTGSIGIERGLSGMATCCAGEPWFKEAPGICNIYDSFKEDGVFFDSKRWKFDEKLAIDWFEKNLTSKTINNYPGIGADIRSNSEVAKAEFLAEFDNLLVSLK